MNTVIQQLASDAGFSSTFENDRLEKCALLILAKCMKTADDLGMNSYESYTAYESIIRKEFNL